VTILNLLSWQHSYYRNYIEVSKTIQSKAEEKLRGDSTPSTVSSNFDDNAAMIGIAPLNSIALGA
jgi:hypothetical protein